jgi:ketosteroid isomerase-like protein
MRIRVALTLLLGVAPIAAGQQSGETSPTALPSVKLPPELARVLIDYEAGWRAGDGAALARLFAEDAFVLGNGAPPVRGRAAIQQYYKGPGGPLALRAFAFATEGPVGYILGGFSRQDGQPDIGKFTLTLRKGGDGRWLIFSDMDNGNRPARRGPEPE